MEFALIRASLTTYHTLLLKQSGNVHPERFKHNPDCKWQKRSNYEQYPADAPVSICYHRLCYTSGRNKCVAHSESDGEDALEHLPICQRHIFRRFIFA